MKSLFLQFYCSQFSFLKSHNAFFWYCRYGLIWISTTLVFVLAALGNCATYLMQKHTNTGTSWSFNVSYMNIAAGSVYGYAAVVPLAFYFLLQYMGSNPSLVRFWCMWGYSLFIFILASVSSFFSHLHFSIVFMEYIFAPFLFKSVELTWSVEFSWTIHSKSWSSFWK